MSHFCGDITGGRGTSTSGGTKNSGMTAHIRGWNVGARVELLHNKETGQDIVRVWRTSGSSGRGHDQPLAEFTAEGVDYSDNADLAGGN